MFVIMKLYQSFMNYPLFGALANPFKNDFHNSAIVSGKISVLRKKIKIDSVEILVGKPAAAVLKKLNSENHHLFGNIIKTGKNRKKKSVSAKRINGFKAPFIQYDTSLTVSKESTVSETSTNLDFCTESGCLNKSETVHFPRKLNYSEDILNTILEFPLLNNGRGENVRNRIDLLRQHLKVIGSNIPSVTTILDRTMPADRAAALDRWRKNMIEEMGKENFEAYQKEMLLSGSTFHGTVNAFLQGTPKDDLTVHASNVGHWKSVQNIFPDIQNVKLLEEYVTHPFLQYKGVVDCLAQYRDQLVVVEWKTSKKPKPTLKSTYDNPLQLAAYIGALNFDPRFQYMVDKGLIVIVYEGGDPAHSHFLQKEILNEHWTEWLKRLKKYWESL